MKKLLSALLATLLLLTMIPLSAISVSAASSGITGDCTWTLDANGHLAISGNGAMMDYTGLFACGPWGRDIVTVTIESGVTNIGNNAFWSCDRLLSVSIPDSVTDISDAAIYGCDSLTSITVAENNGYYSSVDGVLFNKDKTILIQCPGGKSGDYIIPNSVTSIGNDAFSNCDRLTSITIPDSVITIGSSAFSGCDSLTSATIPDSVTRIVDYTYQDCISLTSVTIGDSVTSVDYHAFYGCTSLMSVSIGNNVTSIDQFAFDGCTSLASLTIPDSVITIGNNAFYGCTSLASVIIGDGVNSIGSHAFCECTSLTSLTIGNGIKSIGQGAFLDCNSLTDIYYSGTKEQANTISISFTSNEKLRNATWHYDGGNEEDDDDDNCGIVAEGTTGDCTWTLVEGHLTIFGSGAMADYEDPMVGDVVAPWCGLVEKVTIGDSVTKIGAYAFFVCDLTDVAIPDSVMVIGEGAFMGCENLLSVTIGNGVEIIGDGAFGSCCSLKTVEMGGKVVSIGNTAFGCCESLLSISIPDTVTKIAEGAFVDCDSLTDVYYGGGESDKVGIIIGSYNDYLLNATWHYAKTSSVSITKEPTTGYAKMGEKVSVKVTAEGDGLTYQWYIKNEGATKYSKSSVTQATYSTTMSDKVKGRRVYCIITDRYGNKVQSKTVLLRESVSITKEPATAAYAQMGKKVSVKITAKGDGLKYTWYIKNDGGSKYSKSSITSATYSATMSSKVKGRRIYCVVTDKYGKTVQSKTFILREGVSITTQPKNVTVKKNATAKVSVKASGDGLKYTWYVKNAGATKYTKSSITKATYSVKMTDKVKNRLLYCVVTDKYGNTVKCTTVKLKMK